MVNIVIVSHSKRLAQGLMELASQMKSDDCQIALAAGIDDPDNPIGTDAAKIMAAIEEVYSPDGVVVMVDLGSAILSAETALELLDPAISERVRISRAPLVEGTIGAVVAASGGDSLEGVLAEADLAYSLKG
ncbi:dihydroxyacetone kinase phosphoryl donor subunit DhaM [Conservatibacter flavescens]|uniref:phosphoenolpyruvate--glycerone phosphotransferase n=1 Tax=Conservatibacter flavescens TaxID=28161 RepID=A0A2M8S2Q3_9PAST|nr:dihydroxyacetone kinase phosphoryl donor subunit DhaM [Conservatibacter flavescens]PJG85441.1 PTS mannose transporter subunit IID [Conservatibacter flavescens]